jgi:hypothetical protein
VLEHCERIKLRELRAHPGEDVGRRVGGKRPELVAAAVEQQARVAAQLADGARCGSEVARMIQWPRIIAGPPAVVVPAHPEFMEQEHSLLVRRVPQVARVAAVAAPEPHYVHAHSSVQRNLGSVALGPAELAARELIRRDPVTAR